ncbi:MAG: TonB-dependent receptor, partial [Pseudomonadales bacterium]
TSVGVVPEIARDWANAGDGSPTFEQDTQFTTLTMNYELDNMTLTSVSGHMSLDNLIRENIDRTSYGLAFSTPGEDTQSFSQEFRVITDFEGSLNFSAGLFYEEVERRSFTDSFLFFGGPDPVTGKYHTFELEHQADSRTYSAFLQLRYEFTEKLELAAGARYTDERRTQESENVFTHTFTAPVLALVPAGTTPLNGRFTDTDISPEVTLSYKPSDSSMVYAAYKTGYKSGGFSSPSLYQIDPSTGAPVTAEQLSFDPEEAEGFEVGFKGRLLENTLRLEAVAYHYTYDDLQTSVFEPEAFSFFIKNAASAVVKGVEVSSEWLASNNVTLFTNIAYNRAEFDEFTNGQCYTGQTDCIDGKNNLSGEPLARAPEWNYNLGFSYDLALGNSHMLIVGGDVKFTDDYLTQEDQNPFARQEDFTTINANVRLESNDGKYEITLIGRNLANERYIELTTSKAFGSTTGFGDFTPSTIRGREIRIEGTYHF